MEENTLNSDQQFEEFLKADLREAEVVYGKASNQARTALANLNKFKNRLGNNGYGQFDEGFPKKRKYEKTRINLDKEVKQINEKFNQAMKEEEELSQNNTITTQRDIHNRISNQFEFPTPKSIFPLDGIEKPKNNISLTVMEKEFLRNDPTVQLEAFIESTKNECGENSSQFIEALIAAAREFHKSENEEGTKALLEKAMSIINAKGIMKDNSKETYFIGRELGYLGESYGESGNPEKQIELLTKATSLMGKNSGENYCEMELVEQFEQSLKDAKEMQLAIKFSFDSTNENKDVYDPDLQEALMLSIQQSKDIIASPGYGQGSPRFYIQNDNSGTNTSAHTPSNNSTPKTTLNDITPNTAPKNK